MSKAAKFDAWLGADVGGTFTDLAFVDSEGTLTCVKVPSVGGHSGTSTLSGIAELRQTLGLDAATLANLRTVHSTTLGANALIERRGAVLGLITNVGFRDLLELQRLRVPEPMRFTSKRTEPLVGRYLVREVPGRIDAEGREVAPLDLEALEERAGELVELGVTEIVVCLLHSFTNPGHELQAVECIRNTFPDLNVIASSVIWPQAREFERATLALINGYIRPEMEDYLNELESGLRAQEIAEDFLVARSNGGAEGSSRIHELPVLTLLSGPAAGVAGAARTAEDAGWKAADLITLDVGGTSADIGVVRDGRPILSAEEHIADFPITMPTVAVSSIGAGGGSVIWVDPTLTLRIGPRSLGAQPGPASYGRQDELPALTDAFVAAGWIQDEQLLGGKIPIRRDAAIRALEPIAAALDSDVEQVADAAIAIALAMMSSEALNVLARRGVDAPGFRLVAYGGAGPLVGALIADEINLDTVLVPPYPGALSAYGAAMSDLETDLIRPVNRLVSTLTDDAFLRSVAELQERAGLWFDQQSEFGDVETQEIKWSAEMRYQGQGYDLTVELEPEWVAGPDLARIRTAFDAVHDQAYGDANRDQDVWIRDLRAHPVGHAKKPRLRRSDAPPQADGADEVTRTIRIGGYVLDAEVVSRASFPARGVQGPAIIEQFDCTTLVPPGWTGRAIDGGCLALERTA